MPYIPICEFCLAPIDGPATQLMVGDRFQHLGLACERCMREEFSKHEALVAANQIVADRNSSVISNT